jgi:hypothetical protein
VEQFVIIAWLVYVALGFPDSGSVGWATFVNLVARPTSWFSKLVVGINTVLIILVIFLQLETLYLAHIYQKVIHQNRETFVNQPTVYFSLWIFF